MHTKETEYALFIYLSHFSKPTYITVLCDPKCAYSTMLLAHSATLNKKAAAVWYQIHATFRKISSYGRHELPLLMRSRMVWTKRKSSFFCENSAQSPVPNFRTYSQNFEECTECAMEVWCSLHQPQSVSLCSFTWYATYMKEWGHDGCGHPLHPLPFLMLSNGGLL